MNRRAILIAAIGKSRQLGLHGWMPWEDRNDLKGFRERSAGGVLLMGAKTFRTFPKYDVDPAGRMVAVLQREGLRVGSDLIPGDWLAEPNQTLAYLCQRFASRNVFVCGGATIYGAFAAHCGRFDITRIDYDGPADVYLPPLPFEFRGAE